MSRQPTARQGQRDAAADSSLDDTLIALADPLRRGIVELLKHRPRRAGELAQLLDISAPLMSKHLKVLRSNALIEEDRAAGGDARVRVYRLRPERLGELRDWLQDVDGFWRAQLASFKAAADAASASNPRPNDSDKAQANRRARKTRS